MTERAHAVSPVTKVSDATRNFPAMPKAPSQRELAHAVRLCLREFKASSFSVYHDFCLWKIVCGYVMIGNNEYSRKLTARKVTDHA